MGSTHANLVSVGLVCHSTDYNGEVTVLFHALLQQLVTLSSPRVDQRFSGTSVGRGLGTSVGVTLYCLLDHANLLFTRMMSYQK